MKQSSLLVIALSLFLGSINPATAIDREQYQKWGADCRNNLASMVKTEEEILKIAEEADAFRKEGQFDKALDQREKWIGISSEKYYLQALDSLARWKEAGLAAHDYQELKIGIDDTAAKFTNSHASGYLSSMHTSQIAARPQSVVRMADLWLQMKIEHSNDDLATVYANRGEAKTMLQNFSEAEQDLRKSLEYRDSIITRDLLAKNFAAQKENSKYIETIEQTIPLADKPSKWIGRCFLARAYAASGDLERARKELNLAEEAYRAEEKPKAKEDYPWQTGLAYSAVGDYTEALIRLSEGSSYLRRVNWTIANNVLAERAFCNAKLGRLLQAKQDLETLKPFISENPMLAKRVEAVAAISGADSVSKPIKERWALIVGISNFKDKSIPKLRFSAKDAQDLKTYLVTEAGYKDSNVHVLTDASATRTRILEELADKWLPKVVGENDSLLVFISSHGTPAAKDIGSISYVVAHDTDKEHLFTSGIPMQYIVSVLNERVKCKRTLLITDTCYSGATKGGLAGGEFGNLLASDLLTSAGQLVITSSSPSEKSWESKRYQNGVFTGQFLQQLKGKSGSISVREFFPALREKVSLEVKEDDKQSQSPQMAGSWDARGIFSSN